MSGSPSHFTIMAECAGGQRKATRCQAASAMCLADDWAENGCRNVKIVDGLGASRNREQFRTTLAIVKRAFDRRRIV